MKIFRYLMMAVLTLGISGAAHAFQFTVLDPSGSQPTFPALNVNGPNPFTFYDCEVVSGDGCFGFVNNTNSYVTAFQATITFTGSISDPTPDCPTTGQGPLYPSAFSIVDTCSLSGNTINVALSGTPGIAPGTLIWIVETGIPDDQFPEDAGTFTVTLAPEPSSIWMALTGISSLGYAVRRRRRNS